MPLNWMHLAKRCSDWIEIILSFGYVKIIGSVEEDKDTVLTAAFLFGFFGLL